jgi:hypothetical protein
MLIETYSTDSSAATQEFPQICMKFEVSLPS